MANHLTTHDHPDIGSQTGPGFESRTATIAIAVLGVFVTYLPITGVSVALARIGAATHASTASLQWVSDGYVIPMAAAVLSGGLLGDRYGRRRVFVLGMVFTVVGQAVAGLSQLASGTGALSMIWTGQAVSGLGAGLLLPTTLALVAHVVPDPRERGRFIGMWATGMLLGLTVGPLISGGLLAHVGYGWIYLPTVALAAIVGLLALTRLPESRSPHERVLNVSGQLTATVGIAGLILGVIEGGARGWSDGVTLTGLVVGGIALVAFVVGQRRTDAPLIDLVLFRSAAFSAAGFAAFIALFSIVGISFLISVFLGQAQQLSVWSIGVRLLFVTGVATVLNPFVGAMVHRFRPGRVLAVGLGIAAVGVATLLSVDEHTGLGALSWRLAIFGVAQALVLTTVSVAAVNAAPWHHAGMAAATNTVLRQFGGALGPAVLGTIFAAHLGSGHTPTSALHVAFAVDALLLAAGALACLCSALRPAR